MAALVEINIMVKGKAMAAIPMVTTQVMDHSSNRIREAVWATTHGLPRPRKVTIMPDLHNSEHLHFLLYMSIVDF